ncbi:hypothetical protein AAC387_Pa06g2017 [Persea americana]
MSNMHTARASKQLHSHRDLPQNLSNRDSDCIRPSLLDFEETDQATEQSFLLVETDQSTEQSFLLVFNNPWSYMNSFLNAIVDNPPSRTCVIRFFFLIYQLAVPVYRWRFTRMSPHRSSRSYIQHTEISPRAIEIADPLSGQWDRLT